MLPGAVLYPGVRLGIPVPVLGLSGAVSRRRSAGIRRARSGGSSPGALVFDGPNRERHGVPPVSSSLRTFSLWR